MNKISIFMLGLFLVSTPLPAQIDYPFLDAENDRDIQAYWYNIPAGFITSTVLRWRGRSLSLFPFGRKKALILILMTSVPG